MDGMKVTNVVNKVVAIGDNLFESGIITVPEATTIPAGTVLKRAEDGTFAVAGNVAPDPGNPASGGGWATPPSPGDVPVAVMPFDLTNSENSSASISFRAIISGRVRRDMLQIGGISITDAQCDALRSYTIIPVKVKDLARLDNQ
jgi:hypothetical protein